MGSWTSTLLPLTSLTDNTSHTTITTYQKLLVRHVCGEKDIDEVRSLKQRLIAAADDNDSF